MNRLYCCVFIILLTSCKEDGSCSQNKIIKFEKIHFTFPINAGQVLDSVESEIEIHESFIKTRNSDKHQEITWFYNFDKRLSQKRNIEDILRTKLIYAVSIQLNDDWKKTDAELISNLKSKYPGDYKHINRYGSSYYLLEHKCLSIFLKRKYVNTKFIPEISFCYGLTNYQNDFFGHQTGNITSYGD
jgi:hypothetical protein